MRKKHIVVNVGEPQPANYWIREMTIGDAKDYLQDALEAGLIYDFDTASEDYDITEHNRQQRRLTGFLECRILANLFEDSDGERPFKSVTDWQDVPYRFHKLSEICEQLADGAYNHTEYV